MKIKEEIFREYDIRGIFPDDLGEKEAMYIGKALGTFLVEEKQFRNLVVGRDNRHSSPLLSRSFIDGLLSTGCNVTDVGITLTPLIHFYTCTQGFDAGVNVTASHNPKMYNGFRIDYKNAIPLYGEDLKRIYKIIMSNSFTHGVGKYTEQDLLVHYVNFLKQKFKFKNKYKVVIDCGSGSTGHMAPDIFSMLGMEVEPMYCHLDSAFPHGIPDPENPIFMSDLEKQVKAAHADVGFAFDTDGDRFGLVDNEGVSYRNDKILMFFAEYFLKSSKSKKVVFDVKCSEDLPHFVRSLGGEPKMIKTGHPFFVEEMTKGACLGGEFSGHVFFKEDYFGYDDGIYAACKTLEILDNTTGRMSDIFGRLPKRYSTGEIKITCDEQLKFKIIGDLEQKLSGSVKDLITIDGVRVKVADGCWFLVRASNTSPYLSIRLEAKSLSEAQEIKNSLISIVQSYDLDPAPFFTAKISYA